MSAFYNRKSANFATSRNTDINYKFDFHTQFLILLTFLEFLIIASVNVVTILMMSAKMVTPGFLKIGIF